MNEIPAINEALIRQYVDQFASGDADGLRSLISIFDFQRRQMQRAEDLCRIAWAEVERMAKLGRTTSTAAISEGRLPATTQRPTAKPTSAKAPPAPAVEVNMDDL